MKENVTRSQLEFEIKICKLPKALENMSNQVGNELSFEFDFLREWILFSRSESERKVNQPIAIMDYFQHLFRNYP